ncbi:ricin-type beta-trefoil lectin domain protein [Campylobacter geochelonis]|uniref:ricin-type beta-trefoil lectin domain protein n=1 Tax=Campylobacter geochelonis TaxID=1780362 RepID=UPI00077081CB|nr:ricin-type beta-trefoil lectin domain protein [Campylobacter geochelonis]CZE49312.1 cytolethal distending toxin A [Campylobacter geochelonis]CZE51421.1 cytolethal distending toxin A [Campylobacter geochelonis]
MKHTIYLIFFSICLFISGCSSKPQQINYLAKYGVDINDQDPLKLGSNPTKPTKQKIPALVLGESKFFKNNLPTSSGTFQSDPVHGPNKRDPDNPFDDTKVFYNTPQISEFVSIVAHNDALMTLWALDYGNWVWAYPAIDSISFGDARIWKIIIYPKNFVQIQNKMTGTCLSSYLNGVVHYPCDNTNQSQFWQLNQFANGAVQLRNFATDTCLASDPTKGQSYYAINSVSCINEGEKALSQQWIISPPFVQTPPINLAQLNSGKKEF